MLKAILRSAAANTRRFLYIWLAVLIVNQLFLFGACFAPHCLAAAVPHTLAIAMLMNFFGFRRDEMDKPPPLNSSLAPSMKAAAVRNPAEPVVTPAEWKRPPVRKRRVGPIVLYVLIALCIGIGLMIKNGSRSPDASNGLHLADVEPRISDKMDNGEPDERSPAQAPFFASEPYQEVPDERAPIGERLAYEDADEEIPDEHLSLAQRRGSVTTGATEPHALTRDEEDDDEFDVNDIEQYERLTNTTYRGRTDRTREALYVEEDEPGAGSVGKVQAAATKRAVVTDDSVSQGAFAHHAYQCVNASGRVGDGTGRPTREGEYSAFLRKNVHADEFVIFQYQGSTKEYWFKRSNCQRLPVRTGS